MKKPLYSAMISFLSGACAMACVILCIVQIQLSRKVRDVRETQRLVRSIQETRYRMGGLVTDLQAYGRTNTAIQPLLNSLANTQNQP